MRIKASILLLVFPRLGEIEGLVFKRAMVLERLTWTQSGVMEFEKGKDKAGTIPCSIMNAHLPMRP